MIKSVLNLVKQYIDLAQKSSTAQWKYEDFYGYEYGHSMTPA